MSRGIIINNPGSIETVINITAVNALDGDSIYTGSVYLSNISSDEISAVKTAIESYSPGGGGDDRYDEGYTNGSNDAKHAIAVDHQPIAEEYKTLLPGVADIQVQDPTNLIGQRNIFNLAADYLSEEKPEPLPVTEPYYVPGWFEHQDGNWILVKAGRSVAFLYTLPNGKTNAKGYNAGDVDTWFNVDDAEWRQGKYIRNAAYTSGSDNSIIAMNVTLPNYVGKESLYDTKYVDTQANRYSIWRDTSLVNLKLTIDHFQGNCKFSFYNNRSMITCEIKELKNTPYEEDGGISDTSYMFAYCTSLLSLDLSNMRMRDLHEAPYMFYWCASLQSLNISGWSNPYSFGSASHMFANCTSLQFVDFDNWNPYQIYNTSCMFENCASLRNVRLPKFETSLSDVSYMFSYCYSLQSLDLTGMNVYSVSDFSSMFSYCTSLQSLDISSWEFDMGECDGMFMNCMSLQMLKMTGMPWTSEIYIGESARLSDSSLIYMADNFKQNEYGATTWLTFNPGVESRRTWNYFRDKMQQKGWNVRLD